MTAPTLEDRTPLADRTPLGGRPALEERLARLERSQRRLRRTSTGLALALGAVSLMSFAAPRVCKTIWGERIVLQDAHGRERVVLDAYSNPAPTLTVKDENGKAVASMVEEDGELQLKVFGGKPVDATLSPAKKGKAGGVH